MSNKASSARQKKQKSTVRRLILYLAFCLAVLLAVTCLTLHSMRRVCSMDISGSSEVPIGEITAGTVVCQSVPVDEPLCSVSIEFATWARTNSGTVDVQLVGADSGTVYLREQRPAAKFADNTLVTFEPDSLIQPRDDRTLNIIVTADSAPGAALTIWSSENDAIPGTLSVNGQEQPGDLAILTRVKNNDSNRLAAFAAAVILCLAVFSLFAIWLVLFQKSLSYERLFGILIVFFGLFYLVTITPYSPPDEMHHYNSAYELSNYLLLRGGEESELGDSADFPQNRYICHQNTSDGYLHQMEDFGAPHQDGESIVIPQPRGLSYFPEYLVPAFGIAAARLLHLNFIQTFWLGRLMNLLFFTLCIYFAIRRIPRFKLTLGLLALFPMTLHQAASYSYDVFINGLSFLLIASLFKAIWEEGKLPLRDRVWILVSAMLLSPAKVIYTPLILLACFIPAERFSGKGKKWLFCLLLAAACALMILPFQLSALRGMAEPHTELNWEGGVNYSLSFVFEHPGKTALIFLRTLRQIGLAYCGSMVGRSLSGLSLPVSPVIIFCILLTALASVFTEERLRFPPLLRVFCLALAACILLLAMASMFLCWTSNTRQIIQGVQGRYLIPAEPLMFLPLSAYIPKLKRSYARLLVIPGIALECATLLTVLRYTLLH